MESTKAMLCGDEVGKHGQGWQLEQDGGEAASAVLKLQAGSGAAASVNIYKHIPRSLVWILRSHQVSVVCQSPPRVREERSSC